MKSAQEIREFLLARLRCALLRPGMCGGELGILNLMEYLTFIDERAEEWSGKRKELYERKTFNAGGVTGGFGHLLGFHRHGAHDNEVASVYAVIAFDMGYLSLQGEDRLQRLLTAAEFDSLLAEFDECCRLPRCVPETVIERFGEPSIRWCRNGHYPCTMLYLGDSGDERHFHFDFWAEWHKNSEGLQVPGKYGSHPLLRNVRIPAPTFPEEFRFTAFGEQLLAERAAGK